MGQLLGDPCPFRSSASRCASPSSPESAVRSPSAPQNSANSVVSMLDVSPTVTALDSCLNSRRHRGRTIGTARTASGIGHERTELAVNRSRTPVAAEPTAGKWATATTRVTTTSSIASTRRSDTRLGVGAPGLSLCAIGGIIPNLLARGQLPGQPPRSPTLPGLLRFLRVCQPVNTRLPPRRRRRRHLHA
jgi:hypothetical protein